MSNPAVRYTFNITGYPLLDAFLDRLFIGAASLAVGALFAWLRSKGFHVEMIQDWVNANGLGIQNIQEWLIGGTVAILASVAGLVWSILRSRTNLATYVQAGINLVMDHKALAADGTTITEIGTPGATPSLPVTPATGAQIVKDFAKMPAAS